MTTNELNQDSSMDFLSEHNDLTAPNQPISPSPAELTDSSNGAMFPKIIKFDALARCGEEIWIENNGQIYRLRRTRQGKLILTK